MTTDAPTATESKLSARERALELSGWGLPFRFWQVHNLCFWVFVFLMGIGLWQMVSYIGLGGATTYTEALGYGGVATALYGVVWILFLRLTDHYERQPRKLVVAAFLFGGIASAFGIALIANNAMLSIYPKLFGQAFATDWGAALTAPFSEETSKAAGFILLLGLAPRLIRTPYDAIFIGAFIGLGFQLFEDLLYSYNSAAQGFGFDQAGAALGTFAIRSASGLFSHALYSAVFCCGILYFAGSPLQRRRRLLGASLMLLAMVTHGSWDAIGAIGAGTALGTMVPVLIGVITTIVLFAILRRNVGGERQILREILAPEVDTGTISEAELDALCATRKERKRFIRSGKGHKSHSQAKHVLRAALDLAHEIAAAGGADDPRVEHERREILRLRGGPAPVPS